MKATNLQRPTIAQRANEARSEIKRAVRLLRTVEANKPLKWRHEKFSLLLFGRAIKAAKAALLLADSGFAEESRAILRTINELLQHIAFVNIDHRTRDRKIKTFIELEAIEEKFDDTEMLHGQKMLTTPTLRSVRAEIIRRRRRYTRSPEFEDPAFRFKKVKWKQRNETVLAFLESLEGDSGSNPHSNLLDHCLRKVGNRHVHSGPESLRSVWDTTKDSLGRSHVRLRPSPSRKRAKECYVLIAVMMLNLSHVIAMMYFASDHTVVACIRRHIERRDQEAAAQMQDRESKGVRRRRRSE